MMTNITIAMMSKKTLVDFDECLFSTQHSKTKNVRCRINQLSSLKSERVARQESYMFEMGTHKIGKYHKKFKSKLRIVRWPKLATKDMHMQYK